MVLCKYKLSTFGETKRLTAIDENLIDSLLFVEKLYVFDGNGKRIGRFSLKIDKEEGNENPSKILYVHMSNRAYIDGKLSESVVTGTVTTKMKTLEEIRHECTEVSNSGKHERIMFLLREATKYYLSVTNTICDVKSETHSSIPFVEAIGLIGESANAVLLRVLATKGFEGILCLKALLSNGRRCKNYYVSKLSEQIVNGRKMQVLIVYRNVTNHKKSNVTMTLALTRAGQIIYLFWSNSKCFLHVDPDADISTYHFSEATPGLHHYWHKDIQLYSLYLDRVDQRKIQCRSYKYENEPLQRIVGDFVEYTLLTKPTDVVSFAMKYFTTFGHAYQDESRDAETSNRFHETETDEKTREHGLAENESEGIYFGET